MYLYELQSYEYSNFSYWLLSHEKQYSEEEFLEIVKEADSKIKKSPRDWNYIYDLLSVLGQKYGFKRVHPITCHLFLATNYFKPNMPQKKSPR